VVVDPTKVGYELAAVILIQAEGPHHAGVEKEIAQSTTPSAFTTSPETLTLQL